MKNLKVSLKKAWILTILCLLLGTATSWAESVPKVRIVPLKTMKGFNLFLETQHGKPCTLQISDQSGNFLWKEITTLENYAKSIDLSGLPSSTYRIIATNENGRSIQKFVLRAKTIEILDSKVETVRYPQMRQDHRSLLIDASFEKDEKLNVSILDKYGKLVYRNDFRDLEKVIKLNLRNLDSGKYTILVRQGESNLAKMIVL